MQATPPILPPIRHATLGRRAVLAYLITLSFIAFVMVGMISKSPGKLNEKTRVKITSVVSRKTNEPIISITLQRDGSVLVITGHQKGPLSGGGHQYRLKHSLRGWIIVEDLLWIG